MRAARIPGAVIARGRRSPFDELVAPLFLTPALLLLVLILLGPFCMMVWTSLTDLSYALPDRDGNFIGFDNFRRLMRDAIFWHSFMLTLRFVIGVVAIEFVLGFALALLFRHQLRRQGIVLTLFLIPMMLAPVAIGLIWKLLLQGDFGMLTYYLRLTGIIDLRTALLSDPDLVLLTLMLIPAHAAPCPGRPGWPGCAPAAAGRHAAAARARRKPWLRSRRSAAAGSTKPPDAPAGAVAPPPPTGCPGRRDRARR
jgi:hypothetical protein